MKIVCGQMVYLSTPVVGKMTSLRRKYLTFLILPLVLTTLLTSAQVPVEPYSGQGQNVVDILGGENKQFRVPNPRFRLPPSFSPFHYDVRVRPILEGEGALSAPGTVTIYGRCTSPTNNITLHSQTLVDEASVEVVNLETLQSVPITGHSYDTEKTFHTIELGEALVSGVQYGISMNYSAQVYTEQLEGLYRNHYIDPTTGVTKYTIATQLQAFGARKVFPSFDEPAYKATFDITIGRRSNYSAICNSPLLRTTQDPGLVGWEWDTFNTTVSMSTYLVAIIISDFTYAEASPALYPKPVRTYGPDYLISEGYGIVPSEIGAKVLRFFEGYFDIEYFMHKMDSVGLVDFPAGAMENWGLNLYKEFLLLYGPDQHNERDRRGVALTLAHELSHQWAGNLLTCDWWTMAWLNEGFAVYLSYLAMEDTNPEYEPSKAFQFDCILNAMRNDVLDNSHPTVLPDKGNPWDTMTYNAHLVYSKGAALLKMVEGFMTFESLQKGLQTWMKTYQLQAVNQDQLFEILTTQAVADGRLPIGTTMKMVMDTWTLQKGFPLVKVTLNETTRSVVVTQEGYKPENGTALVYYIPLPYGTQSQPNLNNTLPRYWLFQQATVDLPLTNVEDWVVVNVGGTGYYRIQYDEVLTTRLQEQLTSGNHEDLALGSRTQIIDDSFTLAFDDKEEIETAMQFTQYLNKEGEFSVWNAFLFHMNKPRRLLLDRPLGDGFKSYLHDKVSGALTVLIDSGADITTGSANLIYVQLFDWAVTLEEESVFDVATAYYEEWKRNDTFNPIRPLLRQRVHCAAIGGDATGENFNFAIENAFRNSKSTTERNEIIHGLACRSDSDSLLRLLGVVTGATEEIPIEFSQTVLNAAAGLYGNFANLVPFLINNFQSIIDTHGGNTRMIVNTITTLANILSSSADLSTVNSFVVMYNSSFTDEDRRLLEGAMSTMQANIEWMDSYGNKIIEWSNMQ